MLNQVGLISNFFDPSHRERYVGYRNYLLTRVCTYVLYHFLKTNIEARQLLAWPSSAFVLLRCPLSLEFATVVMHLQSRPLFRSCWIVLNRMADLEKGSEFCRGLEECIGKEHSSKAWLDLQGICRVSKRMRLICFCILGPYAYF